MADEFGDHPGDEVFGARRRCHVFGGSELGVRQGLSVEFSVRGDRHRGEGHGQGRDHVPWESRLGVRESRVAVADHVRDEVFAGGVVAMQHHDGLGHGVVLEQYGFDLTEFDALTSELDLEVAAADVFECAVGAPPDQVARTVQAPIARGVGDESFRCQSRCTVVAVRELYTAEIELAFDPDGHGAQTPVEHPHRRVPYGCTDGHRGLAGHCRVGGDVDGRFGRSVQVVHGHAECLGHPRHARRGQRLTAGEDLPQSGTPRHVAFREEDIEHRRNEMRGGDLTFVDHTRQIAGVAVPVRSREHHRGAGQQRPEQLPHRHVEGRRGLLQDDVVTRQRVPALHPLQPVDDAAMRDRDALGPPGGAGGEQHVREVAGMQGPATIGVRDRAVGERQSIGQRVEHQCGTRRVEDVRGALLGLIRIDGT